jgi:hypothetical protein
LWTKKPERFLAIQLPDQIKESLARVLEQCDPFGQPVDWTVMVHGDSTPIQIISLYPPYPSALYDQPAAT